MAIVLEASRSAGLHASRATGGRATIREVCLIGRERRPRGPDDWKTGQRITWMGRGYQVVAAAPAPVPVPSRGEGDSPPRAWARQYVHLTSYSEG
jgi:hypothetical protein